MPISRRRAKAASRMVLPICRAAASSSSAEATIGPHCSRFSAAEERVEQLPQVLDLLHALEPDHRADHALVLLRVLQLDPERLLHLVDGQRVLDRAALVRLLELLRTPPAWSRSRRRRARPPDWPPGSCRIASFWAWVTSWPGLALVAAGVRGAQEDRDLDLVVPAALHQVHLLAGQQAGAEQRQRDPHRHDRRPGSWSGSAAARRGSRRRCGGNASEVLVVGRSYGRRVRRAAHW